MSDNRARLAVNGGPDVATDLHIPEWPRNIEASIEHVVDAVESGAWCRLDDGASYADRVEKTFADLQDAEEAIAVSNGTVALELALRMLGLEPGDEVIVPAYTFIATASAVACVGAIPRIVDVDPTTYNIDPEAVHDAITDDTVGVIAVHFGGYPVDFDELLAVTEAHELFLVEDAAHAHGTEWRGEKVGTIGDVGTFSFQASKSISSGEGGMVLTDDPLLAERGELVNNIGRVPGKPGYRHYVLSSNYRMSEVTAALLYGQLETFPDQFRRREKNGRLLGEELNEIDGITPRPHDDRITARGYSGFSFSYDPSAFDGLSKDDFLVALRAEGIPAGGGYGIPLTKQPAFSREHLRSLVPPSADLPRYRNAALPGTEETIATRVTIGHQLLLASSDDLRLIPEAIEKIQRAVTEAGVDIET